VVVVVVVEVDELVDVDELDDVVGVVEIGTVDDAESSEVVVAGTGAVSEIVTEGDPAGAVAGVWPSTVVVHPAASNAAAAAVQILVRRVITGANLPSVSPRIPAGREIAVRGRRLGGASPHPS
jgi:hypothetical protein